MKIVDLCSVSPRALEHLFEEQISFWRTEFCWDYRPVLTLVRRFVASCSLDGYASMDGAEACGYGFYVLEDRVGLLGDFFISSRVSAKEVAPLLLRPILKAVDAIPGLRRIETHLLRQEECVLEFLAGQGFRLHERQFMRTTLAGMPPRIPPESNCWRLERWSPQHTVGAARLISLSYANHIDGEINEQYRSEAGALRTLRYLMQTLACGEFIRDASFVLRGPLDGYPVGMVLASQVAERVAHITQMCVMPGYQRNGLGRTLMQASMRALYGLEFRELTLAVTSANLPAVGLYEFLGFQTLRKFYAGVKRQ